MFLKSVEQFKPKVEKETRQFSHTVSVRAGIGPRPWTHKTEAFYYYILKGHFFFFKNKKIVSILPTPPPKKRGL